MEIQVFALWFVALCIVVDGYQLLVFKANSVAHTTDLFTFEGGKDAFSFGR
jgi:hypothetical protein